VVGFWLFLPKRKTRTAGFYSKWSTGHRNKGGCLLVEKSDLRRVAIKPISGLGGDGKMHVDADGRTPLSEYVVGFNRY